MYISEHQLLLSLKNVKIKGGSLEPYSTMKIGKTPMESLCCMSMWSGLLCRALFANKREVSDLVCLLEVFINGLVVCSPCVSVVRWSVG